MGSSPSPTKGRWGNNGTGIKTGQCRPSPGLASWLAEVALAYVGEGKGSKGININMGVCVCVHGHHQNTRMQEHEHESGHPVRRRGLGREDKQRQMRLS